MKAFGENPKVVMTAGDAVNTIKNVFCVGRNYRNHALELGNDVPTAPLIFGKSTHALKAASGQLKLPEGRLDIHHELEVVLYMGLDYTPGCSVDSMVAGVALGLDLTDREAQNRLKKAGQPWEYAKGFPQSAVITSFYAVQDWDALRHTVFTLELDGRIVQQGVLNDMMFDFQYLVDYVGKHFGLCKGDILYTGTPAGVGPLVVGQSLALRMDEQVWGQMVVHGDY